MERRDFIIKGSFLITHLFVGSCGFSSRQLEERKPNLEEIAEVRITALEEATEAELPLGEKLLNNYLEEIKEETNQIESFILSTPGELDTPSKLMLPLRTLTKAQILADLRMYSPIYLAAQREFGVPWILLWIIHTDETTVSRSPNPGISGHIGAMQRMPDHKLLKAFDLNSGEEEYEVTGGWWFLKGLPQRFHGQSPVHSFDYVEIFWAGEFIRRKYQQIFPNIPKEKGMLEVVQSFYSGVGGVARVAKYRQLNSSFQIIS